MAPNQGVKRLKQGIFRNLSPHELARGYVYISMDKNLDDILDTNDFEVEIAGEVCSCRKIGSYGRVQIPIRLLKHIGTTGNMRIKLISRKRLSIGIST